MRQSFFSLVLAGTLSLSSTARAEDCDVPVNGLRGDAIERHRAILEVVLSKKKASPIPNQLIFVTLDAKGENPVAYSLPVPRDGNTLSIPSTLLVHLSKAPKVQVFNETASSPFYFMPYPANGLKEMNVRNDCGNEAYRQRRASRGCSTLNLKGYETLTALYGPVAARCDEVAQSSNDGLVKKSVAIINEQLGIVTGTNRRPSNLEAPRYAHAEEAPTVTKTRKPKPAGKTALKSNRGANKPAAQNAGGGN